LSDTSGTPAAWSIREERTMTILQCDFHPLSNIFPLMEGEDFEQLKEDIRLYGQREPIDLYENKILDGRNRYRACKDLGIEPTFRDWQGNGSPRAFVVSMNLHRRHLTNEQRRTIIALLLKEDPWQSDRQIADAAKVDHKTVGKVREALITSGELPHLKTTKGKDDKERVRRAPSYQLLDAATKRILQNDASTADEGQMRELLAIKDEPQRHRVARRVWKGCSVAEAKPAGIPLLGEQAEKEVPEDDKAEVILKMLKEIEVELKRPLVSMCRGPVFELVAKIRDMANNRRGKWE
jgi:hypothetical protein